MGSKKFIAATAAAFVILFLAGFLIHGILLHKTYESMRTGGFSFRSENEMQHKFWLIPLSDLLFAILFVWIYGRGMEKKPWVGQGIRYGIAMGIFTIVCPVLNDYTVYNLPHTLALHWILSGFVAMILMGLVVAGICKPSAA